MTGRRCLTALLLLALAGSVAAAERSWYGGIGGGVSRLTPDPANAGLELDQELSASAGAWLGRDISDRFSLELGISRLGEADLSANQTVIYDALSAGALFYVSGDRQRIGNREGLASYLKMGFSNIEYTSDFEINKVDNVSLWLGVGIDWSVGRLLGLRWGVRGELASFDGDAQSASLSLFLRPVTTGTPRIVFADKSGHESASHTAKKSTVVPDVPARRRNVDNSEAPELTTVESASVEPKVLRMLDSKTSTGTGLLINTRKETTTMNIAATAGERVELPAATTMRGTNCQVPVDKEPQDVRGCALFGGVIRGVEFVGTSATLTSIGERLLTRLAGTLLEYPQTVVEIGVHTETFYSSSTAKVIARKRAVSVARYLTAQGVPVKRLRARAFGDTQPRAANDSAGGRRMNNRVTLKVLH